MATQQGKRGMTSFDESLGCEATYQAATLKDSPELSSEHKQSSFSMVLRSYVYLQDEKDKTKSDNGFATESTVKDSSEQSQGNSLYLRLRGGNKRKLISEKKELESNSKKKKQFIKPRNSTDWQTCIDLLERSDFIEAEKYANELLKSKIRPEPVELNKLREISKKGNAVLGDIVSSLCKDISIWIKSQSTDIKHVWAAYTLDNLFEVVFLIETNIPKKHDFLHIDYDYDVKTMGQFSEEGSIVVKKCVDTNLTKDETMRIKNCVDTNGKRLMQNHKFLSIIDASPVRSKGFQSDTVEHTITNEPCLVLYVRRKGYIPIDEEPFERQYGDVPTDVREGVFNLFMPNDQEKREMLKIGCRIVSEIFPHINAREVGSLGGDFEHYRFGLCGLTSAHVLLSGRSMAELKSIGGCVTWPDEQISSVYVPLPDETYNKIGRLVQVFFDEGGDGRFGLEIAAFQIQDGYPQSGKCFTLVDQDDDQLRFDKGKPRDHSRLQKGSTVYKFGATTGKTIGKIVDEVPVACIQTHRDVDEYHIALHNQIKVIGVGPHNEICPFAQPGDSGSLVFTKDENNDIVCIGIVEGGLVCGDPASTFTYVTPIVPILEKLGISSFKSFETTLLSIQIKQVEQSLSAKIDNLSKIIDNSRKELLAEIRASKPQNDK